MFKKMLASIALAAALCNARLASDSLVCSVRETLTCPPMLVVSCEDSTNCEYSIVTDKWWCKTAEGFKRNYSDYHGFRSAYPGEQGFLSFTLSTNLIYCQEKVSCGFLCGDGYAWGMPAKTCFTGTLPWQGDGAGYHTLTGNDPCIGSY